jgi:hypothetical protein
MFLRFHTTLLTALVVAIASATACNSAPAPAAAPTIISEPTTTATQQPAEPMATLSPEPAQPPASVPSPAAADVSDVEVVEGNFRLAADGGFFLEMLSFVPDTSDARTSVWVQSLAPLWSAFEEVGFQRPGPEAPDDWATSFIPDAYSKVRDEPSATLRPLVRTPFIGYPRGYSGDVLHYQYVGFDIRSVDESLLRESPIMHGAKTLTGASGAGLSRPCSIISAGVEDWLLAMATPCALSTPLESRV